MGNRSTRNQEIKKVLDYVQENVKERKAESVLSAIESYPKRTVLKTLLGKEQGDILGAEVKKVDCLVGLELGTHCGYSAIKIASTMVKPERGKLISLDTDTSTLEIAQQLMNHAGIHSKVDVSKGTSGISSEVALLKGTLKEVADELQNLLNKIPAYGFNFIFMNHDGDFYDDDLMYLKEKQMLEQGTVIVANTKGFPQDHKYFKYLKDHPEELETPAHGSAVEGKGMTVSTWI